MEQKKNYQEPKYEAVDVAPAQMLCASDMFTPARELNVEED